MARTPVNTIITDISEEDFRKLNLVAHRSEKDHFDNFSVYCLKKVGLNEVLDEEIKNLMDLAGEEELNALHYPITIAIHTQPTAKDFEIALDRYSGLTCDIIKDLVNFKFTYLDKYINPTGSRDYLVGLGIRHLYSTRDYYEARDQYWRVRKNETKVIYRITLAEHWLNDFVLKHKKEEKPWEGTELPEGAYPNYLAAKVITYYDLDDNNNWVVSSEGIKFIYSGHSIMISNKGEKND